jgi:hypothetical protein
MSKKLRRNYGILAERVPADFENISQEVWATIPRVDRCEYVRRVCELHAGHAIEADRTFGRPKRDPNGFWGLLQAKFDLEELEIKGAPAAEIEQAQRRLAALYDPLRRDDEVLDDLFAAQERWEAYEHKDGRSLPEFLNERDQTMAAVKCNPSIEIQKLMLRYDIDPIAWARQVLTMPSANELN